MGALANVYHERFAQVLSPRLLRGEPTRQARIDAYREAFKTSPRFDPDAPLIESNIRRVANNPDVKARLLELGARAAVIADTDRGWCVSQLRQRVEDFNLDDFLAGMAADPDTGKPRSIGRRFNIDQATRAQLGQLSELSIEEETKTSVDDDEEPTEITTIRKIRLKPYDPVATISLIAKLTGVMAPEQHDHKVGGKLQVGLEALVLASMAPPAQHMLPTPQKQVEDGRA
jgi:hypothetical protein